MERTATELAGSGIHRGDAVVVRHRDSAAFVAACAASHAVQAVSVPVLATSGESEIAAIVERIRPGAYAGPEEAWSCLAGLHRLRLDAAEQWVPGAAQVDSYQPDPDAVMEVMFTSGTTGRPKGVMKSANTKLSGLRGFLSTIDARLDDVWGVLAPMAHNAGWLYSYLPALYTGATGVFVGRGDPQRMLDTLVRERVTIAFLVPTHAFDLMNAWKADPGRWPLHLRYVITGAAACPPGLIADMRSQWGVRPISIYGMTECQGNLMTRPSDPLEVVASTVGRPCPGAEVGLRSPSDGTLVTGDGARGEVVTRGPLVYLGYYDDQSATADAFTKDGWFRSGRPGPVLRREHPDRRPDQGRHPPRRGDRPARRRGERDHRLPGGRRGGSGRAARRALGRDRLRLRGGRGRPARHPGPSRAGRRRAQAVAGCRRPLRRVPEDRRGQGSAREPGRAGLRAPRDVEVHPIAGRSAFDLL
jgi:acyl-CoA synthetase (AMP-forming)/AMP-acid ligase II